MYVICILILLLPMMQQQRHDPLAKNKDTQQPQADRQNKQSSGGETGISGNYQIHEPQKKSEQEQEADAFDRGFQRVYWGATILGVVISIGLLFALIHQNKLNRNALRTAVVTAKASIKSAHAAKRSADATQSSVASLDRQLAELEKSANAAKASADAYINGERPWVIPKIRKTVKWIDSFSTEDETRGKPIKRRVVYFTFTIVNHGRTPAEIISIRGNPRLTKEGINGGFTDPPDYGEEYIFMQVRMLAPGQKWDYYDVDLDFTWVDTAMKKDLENFKLHRIFKGVVLYRDVFRPEIIHESRFCYTYFYMAENYLPSGPPDHTKYT